MRGLFVGLLLLALYLPGAAYAQNASPIHITTPASGDVLRGTVNITGTSAVDGFYTAELSFSYASDSTSTWFPITTLDQPVTSGLLATWDTNLVTDGNYDLRLRVTLQDGTPLETIVTGLRIRNQTPTETPIPAATLTPEFVLPPAATLLPTLPPVPTATRRPSPTPLPPNPAAVTQPEITSSLLHGLVAAFLAFIIIGLFLRLRR